MAAQTFPWPAGAPQFASTWEQQKQPNTIRSDMDVSFPKVRRRYTRAMSQFQVSMVGNHAEGAAVQDFFDGVIQDGVNFHTFLHPFTGVLETFRFMEAPQVSSLSSQAVTISMTWEQI